MSIRFVTNQKIAETSSKGNQEKWMEKNRWYKLDQFGYEAFAETVTSEILEKSNIESELGFHTENSWHCLSSFEKSLWSCLRHLCNTMPNTIRF